MVALGEQPSRWRPRVQPLSPHIVKPELLVTDGLLNHPARAVTFVLVKSRILLWLLLFRNILYSSQTPPKIRPKELVMSRPLCILAALTCLCSGAFGQTQAPASQTADQQETIKALMQEVNELKARVAALEAKENQSSQQSLQAQVEPTPQPESTVSQGTPQVNVANPE